MGDGLVVGHDGDSGLGDGFGDDGVYFAGHDGRTGLAKLLEFIVGSFAEAESDGEVGFVLDAAD